MEFLAAVNSLRYQEPEGSEDQGARGGEQEAEGGGGQAAFRDQLQSTDFRWALVVICDILGEDPERAVGVSKLWDARITLELWHSNLP